MAGNTPEYFQHGASFASAAWTALNNSAYKRVTGLNSTGKDHSLDIQLQSLKDLLPIIAQGSSKHILPITSLIWNRVYLILERSIHTCETQLQRTIYSFINYSVIIN